MIKKFCYKCDDLYSPFKDNIKKNLIVINNSIGPEQSKSKNTTDSMSYNNQIFMSRQDIFDIFKA